MTKSEIISRFHLWVDDQTDLSEEEESDLFDDKYEDICNERPWEFTKREFSGTTSTTVPYIALPDDFSYLTVNSNYTELNNEAGRPVVFVGVARRPYKVISYSDRYQYVNQDGYCYIDIVNNRLVFTLQPTQAETAIFDYHAVMPTLDDAEEPVFPSRFHKAIFYAMAADDFIIQQSDKAKSYRLENLQKFEMVIEDMGFWNSNLIQM
jgi:hypothetical protein